MGVKDYSLNADDNTQINGINIAEGCPPSGINNAIRQIMSDVKADSDAQNEALKKFSETPASAEDLGPVKVGDGLSMGGDGTLSANLATADDAGRVRASETAQAGAVPVGGADGTLGEDWLKKAMDAASAAADAAEAAKNTADEAKRGEGLPGKVKKITSRTSTGQWSITGVRIGVPLYILLKSSATSGYIFIDVVSGAEHTTKMGPAIGVYASQYRSSNVFIVIPTSTTVVLNIELHGSGNELIAYQ